METINIEEILLVFTQRFTFLCKIGQPLEAWAVSLLQGRANNRWLDDIIQTLRWIWYDSRGLLISKITIKNRNLLANYYELWNLLCMRLRVTEIQYYSQLRVLTVRLL